MTIKLRQSTASQEVPLGYFVDSTDGNTEETALTIANTDIKLWKMGATTLASKNSGGATHISNGVYYCVLDATDTNTLGALVIFVHVSGALAVRVECEVLPANVYDSWIAGTDKLDVNSAELGGTSQTGRDVGASVLVGDKTGFSLSAAGVQAIWDALTSALTTVGSIGKLLVDNINATISSRSTYAGGDTSGTTTLLSRLTSGRATNLDNLDATVSSRSSHSASDVWAVATRTLTSFGTLVADVWASGTRTLTAFGFNVTVDTNNDKTGYSLTAGQLAVKKNTALSAFEFLMVQSADHVTAATGLTVTAQRSIDGGAFAACTNAVTEVGSGVYTINLAAADLNGTVITLKFTATGADQRTLTILTQA